MREERCLSTSILQLSDIVWLEHGSIRQFAGGGQHLLGYHRKTRDGRVSSKLCSCSRSIPVFGLRLNFLDAPKASV
jgi:hypothetical protein